MKITSTEALDAAVADVVRLKIQHTAAQAEMDAALAAIQKRHQARLQALADQIAAREATIRDYCEAHRAELFAEKKSRETPLAWIGFELTPPRVETPSRRIKWADVIARLQKLPWGAAYLRFPEPRLDKEALLADRDRLTEEQRAAAGIRFVQDEQFFLRPKPDTARPSA
jgi:phage host-nuclease inhibitor protein Gam